MLLLAAPHRTNDKVPPSWPWSEWSLATFPPLSASVHPAAAASEGEKGGGNPVCGLWVMFHFLTGLFTIW